MAKPKKQAAKVSEEASLEIPIERPREEVEEPKAEEPKVEEPKAPAKPKKVVKYKAMKCNVRNPNTGQMIMKGTSAKITKLDNWDKAQVDAGCLKKVKV